MHMLLGCYVWSLAALADIAHGHLCIRHRQSCHALICNYVLRRSGRSQYQISCVSSCVYVVIRLCVRQPERIESGLMKAHHITIINNISFFSCSSKRVKPSFENLPQGFHAATTYKELPRTLVVSLSERPPSWACHDMRLSGLCDAKCDTHALQHRGNGRRKRKKRESF